MLFSNTLCRVLLTLISSSSLTGFLIENINSEGEEGLIKIPRVDRFFSKGDSNLLNERLKAESQDEDEDEFKYRGVYEDVKDTYLLGIFKNQLNTVLERIDGLVGNLVPQLHNKKRSYLKLIDLNGNPLSIAILRNKHLNLQSLSKLASLAGVKFIEQNQLFNASASFQSEQEEEVEGEEQVEEIEADSEFRVQEDVPSFGLSRICTRKLKNNQNYVYDRLAGVGVDIYVLDSGINTNHVDFEGRARLGYNFIPNESSSDFFGHGSHVAGTLAGKVFGVAKRSKVIGIKILNRRGEGTTAYAIEAISKVLAMAATSKRKAIINLSLAGAFSQALNVAADHAASKSNIPVVVAAGNQNLNACQVSPAGAFNVLAVGSTNSMDNLAPTTNSGPCVSIFAPGVSIRSVSHTSNFESRTLSGTSMAAPHVAGILALFWSRHPELSAKQLYALTKRRATKNALKNLPMLTSNLLAYNQL